MKPKVLCVVFEQGWIRPELAKAIILMREDKRVELELQFMSHRPSEVNRNLAVKLMLEGNYDYLLKIDHDNPPLKNPLDLVFYDKDVIACPTPTWNDADPNFPIYFVAVNRTNKGDYREHRIKEGLQEVDAVGSGCMLIARRVLEKVKVPFERKWNEDATHAGGLDFYFCEKAKKEGFSIWSHYNYPCSHFKELDLIKVLQFYGG